jgi:hypothetical protein
MESWVFSFILGVLQCGFDISHLSFVESSGC